jgi:hypothetical protein
MPGYKWSMLFTFNPVTDYKSGMFRNITNKSWLRLGLQCEPRETPTEAEKLVRTARSTGNDTIFQLIVYSDFNNENNYINEEENNEA